MLDTFYLILTTFMAIFLTTFFLIFAFVCVKNIRCGIYAVIFLMPLYLLRFSIFGIPTTVLEIMIYILFLTWILNGIAANHKMFLFVISKRSDSGVRNLLNSFLALNAIKRFLLPFHSSRNDKDRVKNTHQNFILLIGIILLFLGLALSTLHSSDLRTSLGICKGWFFDPFLFFIVFISVSKEKKHIRLSLVSWVFSGVAVSLISIFYLLNNNLSFDGRLSAFYISPNYLAMYISPVFLIALFFLLRGKRVLSIKYQVLSVVILTIIFIPLFFTYSYGAFLGIFAGVIWMFYKMQVCHFNNKTFCNPLRRSLSAEDCDEKMRDSLQSSAERLQRGKNKKLFLKMLTLIILATFISITAVKFNQIVNSESRSSFHSRLMIWNASVEIIKDNPVFGIGPGTFQETYLSYSEKFDEPYLEWAVSQPHNTLLAFYLQTGLIGFVGFILILIWFFYRCRDEAMPRLYGQIISVLMIYILVHGLVDTMYWKNDLSLMFWLVIGLAWCCRNFDKELDIDFFDIKC